MQNHKLKLIVVADSTKANLYEAAGLKITKSLGTISILGDEHNRRQKGQGYVVKPSGQSSGFQPHSTAKDLEHHDAAKNLSGHLEDMFAQNADYNALVIVAEPGMLGLIRQHLGDHLNKKLIKEVVKDLVHQDKAAIEHAVFSE